ncbi:MAG: flavin reductase [Bacteroidota bacterium]
MPTATHAYVPLDPSAAIWPRFFTVAPLVVIGTQEADRYDFAPKHMAMPLGWENYFGFVCTPRHATYHNAKHYGAFTVSFPRPSQVLHAALGAAERCDHAGRKPSLDVLRTVPAEVVEGRFLEDAYLMLECELERVVDGFGANSLIAGRVVAARVAEDALRGHVVDGHPVDDWTLLRTSPLLAYLAPGRYAEIQGTEAFPHPGGAREH